MLSGSRSAPEHWAYLPTSTLYINLQRKPLRSHCKYGWFSCIHIQTQPISSHPPIKARGFAHRSIVIMPIIPNLLQTPTSTPSRDPTTKDQTSLVHVPSPPITQHLFVETHPVVTEKDKSMHSVHGVIRYPFYYGGLASGASSLCCQPLGVVTVRLQTQNTLSMNMRQKFVTIFREEGLPGL